MACHVAGAAPFVIGAGIESGRGYRPAGDDAVITMRSWEVMTAHFPLVGQFNLASGAHAIYDPGPLLFWLLALPVRLDHGQGALWGAALLCVAGVALAIEAAWSVRAGAGAVGVVVAVLAVVVAQPEVVLDPVWNPNTGLIWFLATVTVSWAVASGRLGWTPWLVVAGSVAIQCHLMFAAAAIALMVLAPLVGLMEVARPIRLRWAWVSVAVGVGCWAAPVVQELTSDPGNLTLLLASGRGVRDTGARVGLEGLAGAASLHPVLGASWGVDQFFSAAGRITGHHPVTGVLLLVGVAAVAAGAWVTHRRPLATLAGVTLVVGVAQAWTLAHVPLAFVTTITYLDHGLWVFGLLVWTVAAWTVGALLWSVAVVRSGVETPWLRLRAVAAAAGIGMVRVVAAVVVGGLIGALSVRCVAEAGTPPLSRVTSVDRQIDAAARRVERLVPRGPVSVVVYPANGRSYSVLPGVLWQLRTAGWDAETPPPFSVYLASDDLPTPRAAEVAVLLSGTGGVRAERIGTVPG